METHSACSRSSAALPAQAADAIRVQTHHRHIALPAAIASGVLQPDLFVRSPATYIASRAISIHRDVIAGSDVEYFERLSRSSRVPAAPRSPHPRHGYTTCSAAVAQNAEATGPPQPPHEIEAHAVRLPRVPPRCRSGKRTPSGRTSSNRMQSAPRPPACWRRRSRRAATAHDPRWLRAHPGRHRLRCRMRRAGAASP